MDRTRSRRIGLVAAVAAACMWAVPGPGAQEAPDNAYGRDLDPYMGEYVGTFVRGDTKRQAEAKVVPLGNGAYLLALLTEPGAGETEGGRLELRVGEVALGEPPEVYTTAAGDEPGLNYAYYEGEWDRLPDFEALTPEKTGTIDTFSLDPRERDDAYALLFTGYVKIAEAGSYRFVTRSDDGSALWIGDRRVVDNDGLHPGQNKHGVVDMEAGLHPLTVAFFERSGGEELAVSMQKAPAEPNAGEPLVFTGEADETSWEATLDGDRLTAVAADPAAGRFELAYRERKSPTEGLEPPEGAVILLPRDGNGLPSLEGWANAQWRAWPDGSMQVRGGDNRTVREFGDVRLHLEFRCPFEPEGRGQGRGNSGVYLQSRYEVQVLDSFGLVPKINECGAVYGVAPPRVNASLPPGCWQTYDIVFRAARFAADGTVTEPPTFVSVVLNGITIHENVPVTGATTSAGMAGAAATGPLSLQDHGHPVRYRNIWFVESPEN